MEMMIDALAGTLESSDVMVRIGPANEPGIQLEIDSIVKQQFGAAIERVVRETLTQLGVTGRTSSSMIKARSNAY
jgi:citrate lyase subunit gamma (acyl carrier protein)